MAGLLRVAEVMRAHPSYAGHWKSIEIQERMPSQAASISIRGPQNVFAMAARARPSAAPPHRLGVG